MAQPTGTDATLSAVDPASWRTSPTERLGELERSCNELWTVEPHVATGERSRLLRQLDDLERRITSHTLQLVVDPNLDTEIDDSLCRCERRLSALRLAWGLTD